MFKLYGYVPELKFIKASFDEGTIIDEIGKLIYKVKYVHFMILLQTEDRMIPYKTILSENDYFDLIAQYIESEEENDVYRHKSLLLQQNKR